MPPRAITNTTHLSVISARNANAVSAMQNALEILGYQDQQAAVQLENSIQRESEQELWESIKAYELKSEPEQYERLFNALDVEIERVKTEYRQAKSNRAKFQRQAQDEAKAMLSQGYLSQLGNRILGGIKYFFGSDNESQAQRYAQITKKLADKLDALEKYQSEVASSESQRVSNQAHEDMPQTGRRLLTLPLTNEIQISNIATSSQYFIGIAGQSNGNFIATWSYDAGGVNYDVIARRFNAAGSPISAIIPVNTYTADTQADSVIGVQPNDNFIIAWESRGEDGSNFGIYARQFDANVLSASAEFRVNTYTTNDQINPTIGMFPTGDFIIAWQSYLQDGDDYGIYAQRFHANCTFLGSEFRVNNITYNQQALPAIGVQSNGYFVITWVDYGSMATTWFQRYDANGITLGQQTLLNPNQRYAPKIATLSNGDFWITTSGSNAVDIDGGIFFQRVNGTGSFIGPEQLVNSNITNNQWFSKIAIQADDNIAITWLSEEEGASIGVFAQRLNSTGSFIGVEFKVNTYNAHYNLQNLIIAAQASGDFIMGWDNYGDTTRRGVYARIFRPLRKGNSTFIMTQGQPVTLSTNLLSAIAGGTPSDINFKLSNILNGRFELTTNPGYPITQFTQQQILDGAVTFNPTGSAAPSFTITISDGNETLESFAATINFTPGVGSTISSTGPSSVMSTAKPSSLSTGSTGQSNSLSSTSYSFSSSGSSTGGQNTVDSSSMSGESTLASTISPTQTSSSGSQSQSSSSSGANANAGSNTGNDDTLKLAGIIAGASIAGLAVIGLTTYGIYSAREKRKIKEEEKRTAMIIGANQVNAIRAQALECERERNVKSLSFELEKIKVEKNNSVHSDLSQQVQSEYKSEVSKNRL